MREEDRRILRCLKDTAMEAPSKYCEDCSHRAACDWLRPRIKQMEEETT